MARALGDDFGGGVANMVAAVVFDIFGTLLEIESRQQPYLQLLREGKRQGRAVSSRDVQTLMTFAGNLADLAEHLEIELSPSQRAKLQAALELELMSMRRFDDAWPAVELLAARGIKIGVCSNLAWDYCEEARRLLPGLDAYVLSSECGLMKPDPMIYRHVCSGLGVQPGNLIGPEHQRVLMVGDSRKCDEQGPRACGVLGYHLDRGGSGPLKSLLDFSAAVVESLEVGQE